MLTRRQVLAAISVAASVPLANPAIAMGAAPFDQAAFEAAQAAGKPILVEVTAPWCPTCKAQAPILSRLKADARFGALVNFNIDFDSQKDL